MEESGFDQGVRVLADYGVEQAFVTSRTAARFFIEFMEQLSDSFCNFFNSIWVEAALDCTGSSFGNLKG